jgi:hypothetical protein
MELTVITRSFGVVGLGVGAAFRYPSINRKKRPIEAIFPMFLDI